VSRAAIYTPRHEQASFLIGSFDEAMPHQKFPSTRCIHQKFPRIAWFFLCSFLLMAVHGCTSLSPESECAEWETKAVTKRVCHGIDSRGHDIYCQAESNYENVCVKRPADDGQADFFKFPHLPEAEDSFRPKSDFEPLRPKELTGIAAASVLRPEEQKEAPGINMHGKYANTL
jgi:hypothetical protein